MKLGIDLGGTKIEVVVLDRDIEVFRERVSTPRGDYLNIIEAIAGLVNTAEKRFGTIGRVGIGIPGSLSPVTKRVRNANATELNGQSLQVDLEQALGRTVKVSNDANCFTLSEARTGNAKGFPVVFGVIIGTGTGGGISVHENLLVGKNLVGGEWGHNPLPWQSLADGGSRDCYCGKQNCIETFLSGPGFSETYFQVSGEKLSAKEVVKGRLEVPAKQEALDLYCDQMARSLAHVINIIDPDCIVLGGGLSNIDYIYEEVPTLWKKYVFSDVVATKLVAPKHGDSSGVLGAAEL